MFNWTNAFQVEHLAQEEGTGGKGRERRGTMRERESERNKNKVGERKLQEVVKESKVKVDRDKRISGNEKEIDIDVK